MVRDVAFWSQLSTLHPQALERVYGIFLSLQLLFEVRSEVHFGNNELTLFSLISDQKMTMI